MGSELKLLTSIHYPGMVKNTDNMVETFRGWDQLNATLSDPSKKLRLWLRPNDPLSKPSAAQRQPSSSLLMKVKIKKKSQKLVSYSIVGRVEHEYTFSSLCDFQYLPIDKGVNIADEVLPKNIDPEWLTAEAPLFMPPGSFSRVETIKGFYYRNLEEKEIKAGQSIPTLVVSSRKKRRGKAIVVDFESTRPVPMQAMESQEDEAAVGVDQKEIQKLSELFKDRPIMSRCVMSGLSGLSETNLKNLAPYVSYHFHNGPWRSMWVRFGFDPRKEPSARKYQTLDFRRHRILGTTPLRKTLLAAARGKTGVHSNFIFKPGQYSESRVFYYQLCDIEIPEVQALLSSAEVRLECHNREGWFPDGTANTLRRIMKNYVDDSEGRGSTVDDEFYIELQENDNNPDESEEDVDSE